MEPPVQRKHKAINEFFTPVAKHKAPRSPKIREQGPGNKATDTITVLKTLVPGLSIHHDFVNHTEEQNILNFLNNPSKCTWRTDLSRRTMHFGGTYCLMPSKLDGQSHAKLQILQAPPMPEEFDWLIQRMIDTRIYPDSQRPQYCIVNEYTGNLGISAHTESFRFGEPVVGLSLLSACPIRFHELTKAYDGSVRSGKAGKASKTGRAGDVVMPGRSLLVMKGESRWEWQHEIVRSARGRGVGWKRISLTFRYELNGKI